MRSASLSAAGTRSGMVASELILLVMTAEAAPLVLVLFAIRGTKYQDCIQCREKVYPERNFFLTNRLDKKTGDDLETWVCIVFDCDTNGRGGEPPALLRSRGGIVSQCIVLPCSQRETPAGLGQGFAWLVFALGASGVLADNANVSSVEAEADFVHEVEPSEVAEGVVLVVVGFKDDLFRGILVKPIPIHDVLDVAANTLLLCRGETEASATGY